MDEEAVLRFEQEFAHFLPSRLKSVSESRKRQANKKVTQGFANGSPGELQDIARLAREQASLLDLIDQRNIATPLFELQMSLRHLWRVRDERTFQWGAFKLVEGAIFSQHQWSPYSATVFPSPEGGIKPLPPPGPFEQAIDYLRRRFSLLGHCGNPECSSPFFIKSRKTQKYCHSDCALPSQKAFKRRWWAEKGRKRRKGAPKAPSRSAP